MVALSRRAVLALAGTAAAALAAAGCTAGDEPAVTPAPTVPPVPDPLLAELADEERLVALYAGTTARHPVLAGRLQALQTEHAQHAEALTRALDDAGSPVPAGPTPAPRPVPATPAAALAALRAAERAAAAARGAAALVAPAHRAGLLASVAASEASHQLVLRGGGPRPTGDGLPPTRPPTTTPTTTLTRPPTRPPTTPAGTDGPVPALQTALAAEHAVVWGYGVVGGRVGETLRPAVRDADSAHRTRRDGTAALVRRYGGEPVATEAAYALPFPVPDRKAALRLAVHLEEGVAAAWRYAMESTDEVVVRRTALAALTDAAVRATRWRLLLPPTAPTVAFPGDPA